MRYDVYMSLGAKGLIIVLVTKIHNNLTVGNVMEPE